MKKGARFIALVVKIYTKTVKIWAFIIWKGDERVLIIDENKNIYDPKSNAKSIDSYMFDKNIGSVVKLEHGNGVCAAYSNGESIDFNVVTNQYRSNDWLGCGGKISQNDIFILKTSSKTKAQIVAKSKMKKNG